MKSKSYTQTENTDKIADVFAVSTDSLIHNNVPKDEKIKIYDP